MFCKRQGEREGLVRKEWGDKERKAYCGFKAVDKNSISKTKCAACLPDLQNVNRGPGNSVKRVSL